MKTKIKYATFVHLSIDNFKDRKSYRNVVFVARDRD